MSLPACPHRYVPSPGSWQKHHYCAFPGPGPKDTAGFSAYTDGLSCAETIEAGRCPRGLR